MEKQPDRVALEEYDATIKRYKEPLTVELTKVVDPKTLIRDAIVTLYPASDRRESLAITKLEEALLWLTAPKNL